MPELVDGARFMAEAQSEQEFMRHVMKYAKARGWLIYHTHISKRSTEGWPDLAMVREAGHDARLVVAELKREIPEGCTPGRRAKYMPTLAQVEWLRVLGFVAGVEAYLWRPSDWPEIEKVLL